MPKTTTPAGATSGTYVLEMHFSREELVTLGRQKRYVNVGPERALMYVGSAQRGLLPSRIRRHLRTPKKLHWDIDHLTAVAKSIDPILRPGQPMEDECALVKALADLPCTKPVPGFGNADCRSGCVGHLIEILPEFIGAARAIASQLILPVPWRKQLGADLLRRTNPILFQALRPCSRTVAAHSR